jgi:hypothetical protein
MSEGIVSYGALSLTQRKREKVRQKNEALQREREAAQKALDNAGYKPRSSTRFEPVTEGFVKKGVPVPAPIQVPICSPLAMQRATTAYRAYTLEKDFKKRTEYAVTFLNTLGFHTGTLREGRALLESEIAKREFGE